MEALSGRIFLIANGEPPSKRLIEKLLPHCGTICAVDGGLCAAGELGLKPEFVFGDWDGIDEAIKAKCPDAQYIHTPDQDYTDLDKALSWLIENGARTVSVVGALGRRLDHEIANVGLLYKHLTSARITYHTEIEDAFALLGFFERPFEAGRVVSLIGVFGQSKVSTQGLKYELSSKRLQLGVEEGVCNETLGGKASISVNDAPVLVIIGRSENDDILFAPEPMP